MATDFLFSLPTEVTDDRLSAKARDVVACAALTERLSEEDRTRVAHRSGRAENVAEHSLMLVKIAVQLAQKYYPLLDAGKIALYASLHDDVEAYVGDTPTGEWCSTDYEVKYTAEEKGLEQLAKDFVGIAPEYVAMVRSYENQLDPESRFVRMVDKILPAVIQITDKGQEANKHFTKQSFVSNEQHGYDKHVDEYPEWREILDIKMELAHYIADNLIEK